MRTWRARPLQQLACNHGVGLQVGQTVACLGSGAFSQYVTAKAASCYPIREATAEACACVVSGLTAAAALEVGHRWSCQQPETIVYDKAAWLALHEGS